MSSCIQKIKVDKRSWYLADVRYDGRVYLHRVRTQKISRPDNLTNRSRPVFVARFITADARLNTAARRMLGASAIPLVRTSFATDSGNVTDHHPRVNKARDV